MTITEKTTQKVFKCKESSIELMQLKGYELIKELFVDSSGFGLSNELALTASNFERECIALCKEYGSLTAKIISVGQFQVYIGLFKKTGKAKAKKIALNTYLIDNDNENYILYHKTKILEWKNDFVIIDNGGWYTRTTKERINLHLPKGVYINQKNFEWFINDLRDNTIKPFINKMQIAS